MRSRRLARGSDYGITHFIAGVEGQLPTHVPYPRFPRSLTRFFQFITGTAKACGDRKKNRRPLFLNIGLTPFPVPLDELEVKFF